MKTLAITLATLLVCCAAHGASSQVEVHGRNLHRMSSTEASELQGRYALADGRVLEVSRQGTRLAAVLDGRERPLLAVSPTRLQSADGLLTLDFAAAENGSVHHVTVTLAGRVPVATAPATPQAATALAALAAPAPAPGR
jgi:hypothetical protein